MDDLVEILRRVAGNRSVSLGEALYWLDTAADRIESAAYSLAAERLCRAVEVAVLKSRLDAAIIAARIAVAKHPTIHRLTLADLDRLSGIASMATTREDYNNHMDEIESARAPVARKEDQ